MTTIDQKIIEIIQQKLNINGWPWGNLLLSAIAVLLCVLLCGLVGFEREKRGRSAGLRTHLLVGVGSCVIMIISIYGFPSSESGNRDVARLAAGVLAGVGFLGAGTIIHDHGSIKGLTTAGTIWLVMAIGLACGSFNFILAALSTAVVMIVLTTFRKLEHKLNKKNPILTIITDEKTPVTSIVLEYAKENRLIANDFTIEIIDNDGVSLIQTTFKLISEINADIDVSKVEDDIKKATNAKSITNLNRH